MGNSIPAHILWPLVVFATLVAMALIVVISLDHLAAHRAKKNAERKRTEAKMKFEGVIGSIRNAGGM